MRIPLSLAAMALTLGFAAPVFAQAGAPLSDAGSSAPTPSGSPPAGAAPIDPGSTGGGPAMMSITISPGAAAALTSGLAQPAAPSGSTGNNPSGASDRTVPQPSTAR